jgi:molecular chaperone GrpE
MSGERENRNSKDMPGEKEKEEEVGILEELEEIGKVDETSREPGLEELKQEKDELKNRVLYLHAELENIRKRTAKEKAQIIAFGNERLIKELIPVLDNLELAITHGQDNEEAEHLLSGVELIYNETIKVLKKFGVEQLDAAGKRFDPTIHEAVSKIPDPDRESGTVREVIRKGYLLNGRLLRPVQVVIVDEAGMGENSD